MVRVVNGCVSGFVLFASGTISVQKGFDKAWNTKFRSGFRGVFVPYVCKVVIGKEYGSQENNLVNWATNEAHEIVDREIDVVVFLDGRD